jgi:predicted DNA-binding protein
MARTENLNFRLSQPEMKELRLLANDTGVPRAILVRLACRDLLERMRHNPQRSLFENIVGKINSTGNQAESLSEESIY